MSAEARGLTDRARGTPQRSVQALLFAWIFVGHAYFYNGAGWNQNSRYDVIYAFVEPGTPDHLTFHIDRFIVDPAAGMNTGDWAFHDGHFYSNKPIGTALLGIPLYFALYHAERAFGLGADTVWVSQVNAYVLNLWISVFFTALASLALFRFLVRTCANERDALFAVALYAFGSLAFPFDTQLWSHTTAAAFLLLGLTTALDARGRRDGFLAGVALGLAVHLDYVAAMGVGAIVAILTVDRGLRRVLPWVIAGGIPLAIALVTYHKVCFGGWFAFATGRQSPLFMHEAQLLGSFRLPTGEALWGLLFSAHRGLLVSAPVLALAALSAFPRLRPWRNAWAAGFAAAALGCWLVIASFTEWHGGHSTGSRYLIVSLPFWILLVPPLSRLGRRARAFAVALAVVSAGQMLLVAAVNPMIRPEVSNPWGELWTHLFAGDFPALTWLTHMTRHPTPEELEVSTFNLGMLVGFRGAASLVPYLVLWLGGLAVLARRLSPRSPPRRGGEPAGGSHATALDGVRI